MPKDDKINHVSLDNITLEMISSDYIYGNCPLCEKAAYHKVKKPVFIFMNGVEVKIFVYKCSKCKKRWGRYL